MFNWGAVVDVKNLHFITLLLWQLFNHVLFKLFKNDFLTTARNAIVNSPVSTVRLIKMHLYAHYNFKTLKNYAHLENTARGTYQSTSQETSTSSSAKSSWLWCNLTCQVSKTKQTSSSDPNIYATRHSPFMFGGCINVVHCCKYYRIK